jgi:hypothetical protein
MRVNCRCDMSVPDGFNGFNIHICHRRGGFNIHFDRRRGLGMRVNLLFPMSVPVEVERVGG